MSEFYCSEVANFTKSVVEREGLVRIWTEEEGVTEK